MYIENNQQIIRSFNFTDMNIKQNWTEVMVPIRPSLFWNDDIQTDNHGAFTLEIGAILNDASDNIKIKEIHFDNCNPKRTIGDCDFENENLCHWTLNKERSILPWIIGRGDQVNSTYAPTADHTFGTSSGHFLWTTKGLVNASNTLPLAVLSSPPLDFRVCVSLWYYLDGASYFQLSITDQIITSSTIRHEDLISIPTGGMWQFKELEIMYRGGAFKVNIEAEIEDPGGVIAIDDIQIKCNFYPTCIIHLFFLLSHI